MNSIAIVNITRFILIILLQITVLNQMSLGPILGEYFRVFLYPLFLLLLPFRTAAEWLMLIGFATGISVDIALDTYGIHASSAVFLMALRGAILNRIQPKGGYNINKGLTPDNYGWNWFIQYILIAFVFFSIWLSILEVFQIWRVGKILLRAAFSIPISVFFIIVSVQVLNPRN